MIAPGGGFFNKMMQGQSKMGVQPNPSQMGAGMGQGMGGMVQGMGNAATSIANSIGPSQNFMQKIAPPGAGGLSKFLARGLPGLPGSKGIGKALGGLFGFGRKKQQMPMQMPQQGMAAGMPQGMPQEGMPMGMPEMPQEIPQQPMGSDDSLQAIQGGMGQSIGPSMDMNQMLQAWKKGPKQQMAPTNQAIMG